MSLRFAAVMVEAMRTNPFVSASRAAVGTWVGVYCHACHLELQGRVPGCAGYGDRQWLAVAQSTAAEVVAAVEAGLLRWDDDDLVVVGYDRDGEAKAAAARANGKLGGRPPKTQAKPRGKPRRNPPVSVVDNQVENPALTQGVTQVEPRSNPLSGSGSLPDPLRVLSREQIGGSSAPAADGPAAEPPVLIFRCAGKIPTWGLMEAQVTRWRELYPDLDVMGEARKALAWVEANPQKRKTAVGMQPFLVRWLNNAQDRPRGDRSGTVLEAKKAVPYG